MCTNEKVFKFVSKVFNGIRDKAGNPYIVHCQFVANESYQLAKRLGLSNQDCKRAYQIGLLHDVLEDTQIPEKTLLDLTGDTLTVSMVKVLSKNYVKDTDDYLKQIKDNPLSLIVKHCDSYHNSDYYRYPIKKRTKAVIDKCKNHYQVLSAYLLECLVKMLSKEIITPHTLK